MDVVLIFVMSNLQGVQARGLMLLLLMAHYFCSPQYLSPVFCLVGFGAGTTTLSLFSICHNNDVYCQANF